VEDKDGNSMMIDGAGNITLKSNKTVTIDAVNEITLKTKKISMLAENEIYMEAKNEQIKLESKKLDGQFSQTAEIFGKTEMKIHSQGESIVNGKNKVSVGAEGEVKVLGQQTVNVDSRLINITGEADVVVKAAGIKLNC
jgi:uncharacterized protein (DUF2345 family)